MFVNLCDICGLQKKQVTQAPLKPIIASGFMSRGQVRIYVRTYILLYSYNAIHHLFHR